MIKVFIESFSPTCVKTSFPTLSETSYCTFSVWYKKAIFSGLCVSSSKTELVILFLIFLFLERVWERKWSRQTCFFQILFISRISEKSALYILPSNWAIASCSSCFVLGREHFREGISQVLPVVLAWPGHSSAFMHSVGTHVKYPCKNKIIAIKSNADYIWSKKKTINETKKCMSHTWGIVLQMGDS